METISLNNTQIEKTIRGMIADYSTLVESVPSFSILKASCEKLKNTKVSLLKKESKYVLKCLVNFDHPKEELQLGEIKPEQDYQYHVFKELVLNSFDPKNSKKTISHGLASSISLLVAKGDNSLEKNDEKELAVFNLVSNLTDLEPILDYCVNANQNVISILKNNGISENEVTLLLDYKNNGQEKKLSEIESIVVNAELNKEELNKEKLDILDLNLYTSKNHLEESGLEEIGVKFNNSKSNIEFNRQMKRAS